MTDDFSLQLFSSVKDGISQRGDITSFISDWRRSIRLQGGFWMGSFTIIDEPISIIQQIYYESMFDVVRESTAGGVTWEGEIYQMDMDDNQFSPRLDVTVCGSVFKANWRLVTAGDGANGNASDWISDILTTDCAEFLNLGRIDENTLQVYRDNTELKQYAWDAMMKVVELGDANAMPWQLFVDVDRKVNYRQIPTDPQYYVIGGIKRRRSSDWLYNDVQGNYTNNTGKSTALAQSTNAISTGRYGTRSYFLALDGVTQDAAEARRDLILKESAYPRSRTVGTSTDIELSSLSGEDATFSPWKVRPGVFKDAQYPERIGSVPSATDWLKDDADFLVEEIEVSEDGRISLRTAYYTEADMLETQDEYQQAYGKQMRQARKKAREKKRRRRR